MGCHVEWAIVYCKRGIILKRNAMKKSYPHTSFFKCSIFFLNYTTSPPKKLHAPTNFLVHELHFSLIGVINMICIDCNRLSILPSLMWMAFPINHKSNHKQPDAGETPVTLVTLYIPLWMFLLLKHTPCFKDTISAQISP